ERPIGDAVDDHVDHPRGQHGGEEDSRQHDHELPAVERGGHAEEGEVAERDEEAQHEDVAVCEVDEADDPVDHGVAEGDEREDGAAGHPVDGLLDQNLVPVQLSGLGGSGAAPPPDLIDLDRGGAAPLLPRNPPTGCPRAVLHRGGRGYSRMASNWNLQPMGPSDFTTLKPDMVS